MVYLMLADGFEVTEALTTVDVLRRAGLEVLTVGVTGKTVNASCNIKVEADITPDELEVDRLDAVVLPGGMPGTTNLGASEFVDGVLDFAIENDKLICAICAAPSVLAKKGILNGKNATCFPGCEVNEDKVNYTGDFAVRDGKVITGKGAGCTINFALLVAESLTSAEVAENVRKTMQCP